MRPEFREEAWVGGKNLSPFSIEKKFKVLMSDDAIKGRCVGREEGSSEDLVWRHGRIQRSS